MSTKVPPDGGWGWVIVLANGLNGVSYHVHFIMYPECNRNMIKIITPQKYNIRQRTKIALLSKSI